MTRKLLNLKLADIRTITRTGDRTKARGVTVHTKPQSGPLGPAIPLGRLKAARRIGRQIAGSRRSGGTSLNPQKS